MQYKIEDIQKLIELIKNRQYYNPNDNLPYVGCLNGNWDKSGNMLRLEEERRYLENYNQQITNFIKFESFIGICVKICTFENNGDYIINDKSIKEIIDKLQENRRP